LQRRGRDGSHGSSASRRHVRSGCGWPVARLLGRHGAERLTKPDLGAVKTGASRGEIEMHLGSPISSTLLDGGHRADLYQYEIGNEPSAGRAAGHAVMDVLTLCLWEIVGTPIEAVQGEQYTATVEYDANDKVVDLKTVKASSGT
jgi:hypothetical protein